MIDTRILRFDINSEMQDILEVLGVVSNQFVSIIQKFNLQEGVDIACWFKDSKGSFFRRVYSTGPISPDVPSFAEIEVQFEDGVPRSKSIELAVAKMESGFDSLDWIEQYAKSNSPLIDSTTRSSQQEFNRIQGLVKMIEGGCKNSLGVDSAVRCTVVKCGETISEAKSWNGELELTFFWEAVSRLFSMASIARD